MIIGGFVGGVDYIFVGFMFEEVGLDGVEIVEKLNYILNLGGGEVVLLFIGGKVLVGILGVGEFV